MDKKVFWLADSEEGMQYNKSTYYRCVGIEDFVKKVEDGGNKIVGITFSDNNLGFILE